MIKHKIAKFLLLVLFTLALFNTGIAETNHDAQKFPSALLNPQRQELKPADSSFVSQDIKIILFDAITQKEIKGSIKINNNIYETPYILPFKAGFKTDITILTLGYFERTFGITLTGRDSRKFLMIPCYPKIVLVQGEVFNPDGSSTEGIEVRYDGTIPENYYPGYHRLRTEVNSDGYYYLIFPDNFLDTSINLSLISGFNSFETKLNFRKTDVIIINDFAVQTLAFDMLVLDHIMQQKDFESVRKSLNFQDNGKILFEQGLKIEKLNNTQDLELVLNIYKNALEFAKDDITLNYILSRLKPIYIDLIKIFDNQNNYDQGLIFAEQATTLFDNNEDFIRFSEKFEYLNIPSEIKSLFNHSMNAFYNNKHKEALTLFEKLILDENLPKVLKSKVIQNYDSLRETLTNLHLNKTTDLYAKNELLQALLELDETAKYSSDEQILGLFGQLLLENLRKLNTKSSFAYPLRPDWKLPNTDFAITENFDYAENQQRWFLITQQDYAKVEISLEMSGLRTNHYQIELFKQNQNNLTKIEPGDLITTFNSNDIVFRDEKDEENKPPDAATMQKYLNKYKETVFQLILAPGNYFLCVSVQKVEKLEFTPNTFGIQLETKFFTETGTKIKKITPSNNFDNAPTISQGYYTAIIAQPKSEHYFKIESDREQFLNLYARNHPNSEGLIIQLFNEEKIEIKSDDYEETTGYYNYKIEKGEYYIKIYNSSEEIINYDLRIKIYKQIKTDEGGTGFQNAIAIRPGTRFSATVRRGQDKYYWFQLKDSQYAYVHTTFTHSQGDIDMFLYKQLDDQKRELMRSSTSLTNMEYFSLNLEAGLYYIRLTCNSFFDTRFTINLHINRNVISEGRNFNEALPASANSQDIEISLNAQQTIWYQFRIADFGELNIEATLSHNEKIKLLLYSENESSLISEAIPDANNKQVLRSKQIIGAGLYYVQIRNDGHLLTNIKLRIRFTAVDSFNSFDDALEIKLGNYKAMPVEFENERYFRFNIEENGRLLIFAMFSVSRGSIDLTLFDEAQNELQYSNSETSDEMLEHSVQSGAYFLKITNKTPKAKNIISLSIDFEQEATKEGRGYSEKISLDIAENLGASVSNSFSFKIEQSVWLVFELPLNRRLQFQIDSEIKGLEFIFEIYRGFNLINRQSSARGSVNWSNECESGIYFVRIAGNTSFSNEERFFVNITNGAASASLGGDYANTTRESATQLSKSSIIPLVYQGQPQLWFKFVPRNNSNFVRVAIYSDSEVDDFLLTIEPEKQGGAILSALSSSSGFPVFIEGTFHSGEGYYVRVESRNPVKTANIVFVYLAGPADKSQNTKNSPLVLSVGEIHNVRLRNDNADYYILAAPGRIRYNMTCRFPETNADIDIELRNFSGDLIAISESTEPLEVIEGILQGGLYYLIVISRTRGVTNVRYNLTFNYIVEGDLLTPENFEDLITSSWLNTTLDKAIELAEGRTINGFAAMNKEGWYKFTLTKVMLVSLNLRFDNNKGTLDLSLLDNSSEIQVSQTSSGTEVIVRACNPGEYYVRIRNLVSTNPNKFDLTLNLEDIGDGYTKESARIIKLEQSHNQSNRQLSANIVCKSRRNLQNWYKIVLEHQGWLQISGLCQGSRGYATIMLLRQKVEDLTEKGDADQGEHTVAQLYLEDPNIRRMQGDATQEPSINLGLSAGTYYITVTGLFDEVKLDIACTYLTGYEHLESAPEIFAGTFKNFTLPANSTIWFKVAYNNDARLITSLFSETNIDNISFELHSSKIKIQDCFRSEKSVFIFSEIKAGDYYLKISSNSDTPIIVDFNMQNISTSRIFANLTILTNNAKVAGSLVGNNVSQYLILLKEQTKINIKASLSESRGVLSMNLNRLTLPFTTIDRNDGSSELNYEVQLDAGVYVLSLSNQAYISSTNFTLSYEIPGTDLSD